MDVMLSKPVRPYPRGKVNLNRRANSSDFQVSSGSLFTPGKFQHAKDKIRRIEDINTLTRGKTRGKDLKGQ